MSALIGVKKVATAAVNITSDFNSYELYSWVPVAYLVTINAVQPIYGRRRMIYNVTTDVGTLA